MVKSMKTTNHAGSQSQLVTIPNYQAGATLLVVLLFLVLIMLAGVIAVRQSTTNLKTATADQINTLLLQAADSGHQKLEAMLNGKSSNESYQEITSASGAIGYFLLSSDNNNNEFIYCYNPREKKYLAKNATILTSTGGYWSNLNYGYCDYTDANSYISARQTAMTQMSVTVLKPDINAEPFSHFTIGKEVENRTSQKFKFNVKALSALPAYAEPKDASGNNCFAKSSVVSGGVTPTLDCMRNANTPSKMIYEQADVENMSSATQCIPFGKGSLSESCTLTTPSSP